MFGILVVFCPYGPLKNIESLETLPYPDLMLSIILCLMFDGVVS
jgi:hypothetical protein